MTTIILNREDFKEPEDLILNEHYFVKLLRELGFNDKVMRNITEIEITVADVEVVEES